MTPLIAAAVLLAAQTAGNGSAQCTYTTSQWDVVRKTSRNRQTVSKPYAEVTADERDPVEPRCSVCREDQVRIEPKTLGIQAPAFEVCHVYADDVRRALQEIAADKAFEVKNLVGYRVGRTRGPVVDGLRTEWSNHSFGAALDVNAGQNGLYGNCDVAEVTPAALAKCKLRVGGAWDPAKRPRTTVTRGGVVVRAFGRFWRWGGEIAGGTRDLMHFSVNGK